jgi:hypothetical protein
MAVGTNTNQGRRVPKDIVFEPRDDGTICLSLTEHRDDDSRSARTP